MSTVNSVLTVTYVFGGSTVILATPFGATVGRIKLEVINATSITGNRHLKYGIITT
jgi:hypothetical protein